MSRIVVMQVTLEVKTEVPDDWTVEEIEFHRNESSWCTGNWQDDVIAAAGECQCGVCTSTYLREAT